MKHNESNKTFLYNVSTKLSSLWNKSFSSAVVSHDGGENVKNSFIIQKINKIPLKKCVFTPVKKTISKIIDDSFIISKMNSVFEYLLSLSIKCYGWAIATFTAISLLFNFLNVTFDYNIALNSAIVIMAVLPLLVSSKSISLIFCESGIFSFLFLELLRCDKLIFYSKKENHGSISGAIIVGFIASFFTLAYPRESIVIFILMLCIGVFFMCKPECAALCFCLSIPFLNAEYLKFFAFLAVLSYFVKIVRGKRNLYINFYDLPVLIFSFVLLFIPSGTNSFAVVLVSSLLYLFFSGIIRSEYLLKQCIRNVFISVSIYSIYNVIRFFIENKIDSFNVLFTGAVRENTIFSNTQGVSILYACAFIIGVATMFFGTRSRKYMVFIGLVFNFIALCLCGVEYTAFATIVSLIVLFVSLFKNKILVFVSLSAVVALVLRFFSVFSDTVNGAMTAEYVASKYSKYLLFGIDNSHLIYDYERIPNAGNLWLQLSLWGGIGVVILILITTITFIRNGMNIEYSRVSLSLKSCSVCVSAIVIAYFISSFGVYGWNNYGVYILFWVFGGLSSAVRKLLIKENSVKDIVESYEM